MLKFSQSLGHFRSLLESSTSFFLISLCPLPACVGYTPKTKNCSFAQLAVVSGESLHVTQGTLRGQTQPVSESFEDFFFCLSLFQCMSAWLPCPSLYIGLTRGFLICCLVGFLVLPLILRLSSWHVIIALSDGHHKTCSYIYFLLQPDSPPQSHCFQNNLASSFLDFGCPCTRLIHCCVHISLFLYVNVFLS